MQQADLFLALQTVWKQVNEEESVNYLKNCISKPELSGITKICVPSPKTFDVNEIPEWAEGTEIDRKAFDSIIHLDLGIFLLHKGDCHGAVAQFEQQNIPVENFPFYKISKAKLEGYLRAVGLLKTFDQSLEDKKVLPRSLDHEKLVEMTIAIKKGQTAKLRKMKGLVLEGSSAKVSDRLNPERKDKEDGVFVVSGNKNFIWRHFLLCITDTVV
jgi:hypothetical protein